MWDEIVKEASDFKTAVLSFTDADGYPFSIRCRIEPDEERQLLLIRTESSKLLRPGPAGLLWHRHNDALWELKNFVVRGTLAQGEEAWHFRPLRLILGSGIGGPSAMLKFIQASRETAKRYLEKRGLERPTIPWSEIKQLRKQCKK